MVNKKLWITNEMAVIICVLAILLIPIFFISDIFNQTKFTIYKNECKNEIKVVIPSNFTEINLTTLSDENMIHLKIINNGTNIKFIDVECNRVEVDEKESLCYDYNGGEIRLCKSWEYESISNLEKIRLLKQWLDENCLRNYNCYNPFEDVVINKTLNSDEVAPNVYCTFLNYKCFENYEVIVNGN